MLLPVSLPGVIVAGGWSSPSGDGLRWPGPECTGASSCPELRICWFSTKVSHESSLQTLFKLCRQEERQSVPTERTNM
jgi:hypothetical protein